MTETATTRRRTAQATKARPRSSRAAEKAAGEAARRRFGLLLADALGEEAATAGISEAEARNIAARLVKAGLLQERRSARARTELARALGPGLDELDPVPRATVEQARHLAALRATLLAQGAYSTAALAEARAMTPTNARQWISRHRRSHRLFTVNHEGETLVPAFLLDEKLDPRPEAHEAIEALKEAGEDGWGLWAWFVLPSAWLDGAVASELLATDPERVARAARDRAASGE